MSQSCPFFSKRTRSFFKNDFSFTSRRRFKMMKALFLMLCMSIVYGQPEGSCYRMEGRNSLCPLHLDGNGVFITNDSTIEQIEKNILYKMLSMYKYYLCDQQLVSHFCELELPACDEHMNPVKPCRETCLAPLDCHTSYFSTDFYCYTDNYIVCNPDNSSSYRPNANVLHFMISIGILANGGRQLLH